MTSETAPEKGMTIFLDVFRRADSNDDGFISWEEFVRYFADGVMGEEELRALFNEIDTHNTNNIDINELCSYFAAHLGDFKSIYGTLEDLTSKVTKSLFATSETYESSDRFQKFVTRFFMREIHNQTFAIQIPLEAATEELDKLARKQNADINPMIVESVKAGSIIPGRIVRRHKRQVSSQGGATEAILECEGSNNPNLTRQVDRLEQIIDKIENKVNFNHFVDEEVVSTPEEMMFMVQRNFDIKPEVYIVENFRIALKTYVESIQGINGCLNVSVRSYPNFSRFCIYEIWESESCKNRCLESECTTTFATETECQLSKPESISTMTVPASWWQRMQ